MGRLLILVILVAVVAWMVMSRRRPDRKAKPPPASARGTKTDDAPARMLACVHCGVHLPQSEAVSDAEGRAYCSDAHRLAGPR